MATKPLKTLTFEGLDDIYTVPQIDNTLSVSGKAADAKATGDALADKASVDGTVGTAHALVGGKYTPDSEPYHFRQSPSGGAKDEVIVGGSLGWNQLCNGSSVTVQSGHKYIAKISGAFSIGASTGTAITGLTSGTDMVIDLTACFGSAIADYIYSLETATAGAGVAWVKRYIDLDTYHEYDAGSIKSVEGLVSHVMVGWNQWDEEWEVGSYNTSTGEKDTRTGAIRSISKQRCISSTPYCISFGTTSRIYIYWYNADKKYIKYDNVYHSGDIKTAPENAAYFTISTYNDYGTTYKNDICINISDSAKNGTYEPYKKHSYALDDSLTLRGIPKLDSQNNVYYDGDVYEADGKVTRKYGVVDLGTQTWRTNSIETNVYEVWADLDVKPSTENLMSNLFVTRASRTNVAEYAVRAGADNFIACKFPKSVVSSEAQANQWFANHSAVLVYELATPTTETVTPFQSPMIVGATEEYVSDSVVPVGHESKYYEDVAKKVSGLPKDFSTLIAPVEVTYTATRNYSVGNYLIVKNQLYKVSSAISSGGTITPNSNVTATTIMTEIMTLQ